MKTGPPGYQEIRKLRTPCTANLSFRIYKRNTTQVFVKTTQLRSSLLYEFYYIKQLYEFIYFEAKRLYTSFKHKYWNILKQRYVLRLRPFH